MYGTQVLVAFLAVGTVVSATSPTAPTPTPAPEPTQPVLNLPGPCRAWQPPCGQNWTCTTEQVYQHFRLRPQLGCTDPSPVTSPPPAERCEVVDGTCQFTNSTFQCTSWLDSCRFSYQCGSVEDYSNFLNSSRNHCTTFQPVPQPNSLCLPINNTCQWYNPCRFWRGHCLSGYNCGTADQYYAFIYGPHPLCVQPPPGWTEPLPPGECQLDGNSECAWSNCTSWLGWCQYNWYCNTEHEKEAYFAGPPPSCPAPPPGYTPPPRPGVCRYNILLDQCQFDPETPVTTGDSVALTTPTPQTDEDTPPTTSSPPTCTNGKEYRECGPICPDTCDTVNGRLPCFSLRCGSPGCYCPSGTVLHEERCILPSECPMTTTDEDTPPTTSSPPTCTNGREYRECGPICPDTCDTVNGRSPCFSLRCGSPGCYCPSGTVLHEGRCILPSECPSDDPCAVIDCLPHYTCEVSTDTGEGVCVPSCGNDNGGCPSDQLCVISDHYLSCFYPPSVPCYSQGQAAECVTSTRCVVQNVTKEVSCVPSCFLDNGGCKEKEVCVNHVTTPDCNNYPVQQPCLTNVRCLELNDLPTECPAGMVYSDCGSYCESSCETELSHELVACAAVCVSGCFCPRGLVKYRDRCVDPRECYSLVQDPPPPNPLPVKRTAVVLSMTLESVEYDEFKELEQDFLDAVKDLLGDEGFEVQVKLHAVYTEDQDKLKAAIEVSGDRISKSNAHTLAALISDNPNALPVQVREVSVVPTQVQQGGQDLSTGAILGIVIGAVVLVLGLLTLIGVLIVVVVAQAKKNPQRETSSKESPPAVAYSKLQFDQENADNMETKSTDSVPEKKDVD